MMPYCGPGDTWRRFMSGLTITADNFLIDNSEWVIRPMTQWDNNRLAEVIDQLETGDYRRRFNAITAGVRL